MFTSLILAVGTMVPSSNLIVRLETDTSHFNAESSDTIILLMEDSGNPRARCNHKGGFYFVIPNFLNVCYGIDF